VIPIITELLCYIHGCNLFKNKSAINATYNPAFLLSTSGNRARNTTVSQLAANLSLTSVQFQYRLWFRIAVTIVPVSRVPRRDPVVLCRVDTNRYICKAQNTRQRSIFNVQRIHFLTRKN